jgi:hypothetical protein
MLTRLLLVLICLALLTLVLPALVIGGCVWVVRGRAV